MNSITLSRRERKEAIGLLSVGSFLESFDLWLYVHMAVLLNDLFFPKADPYTAALQQAFAYCSTFALRPFGALLFGYIGDKIGRKATIIVTTLMMAVACVVMAVLPTYAQIGITAAWIVIICRILQGLSALGERVGAELYLTEITKPPLQYLVVGLLFCALDVGGLAAIGVSALVTSHGFNWRFAFLIGAVVAVIGSVARTRLKESPEFIDAKGKIKRDIKDGVRSQAELDYIAKHHGKVSKRMSLAYFLVNCGGSVAFYLIYIYCGSILKDTLGCTAHQVLVQNFFVGLIQVARSFAFSFLSLRVYPLKTLKVVSVGFFLITLASPLLLNHISTSKQLFFFQAVAVLFMPTTLSADPIFYKQFPVLKRFTYASFLHAMSRAMMAIIPSFGFVFLIKYFGYWGLLILLVPVVVGYGWGLLHFEKLEHAAGNDPSKVYKNLKGSSG
ncbi:MAG: Proline/betaine transporter [Bacteroidota bacterium]|jgi:MFS family permease